MVVEDLTLTVWRLPSTVCFAVKNNVIVQLPVAWGEQVTGALTELAPRLAVPTEVSVIVPWGEGAALPEGEQLAVRSDRSWPHARARPAKMRSRQR